MRSSPQKLALSDDWMTGVKKFYKKGHHWNPLMLGFGSGNMRKDAPNCFYPVFVSEMENISAVLGSLFH